MAIASLFNLDDSDSSSDSDSDSNNNDNNSAPNNLNFQAILPMHNKKSLCPTIDLSHITAYDYSFVVYEPSSDSYLLMDCIENDIISGVFDNIFNFKSSINIFEIGCGTGIVLTHTHNVINKYTSISISISIFGIDINSNALKITKKTLLKNGIKNNEITLIQSDLLNGINIDNNMFQNIDIMIFNPPYVPTTNEELNKSQNNKLLSASWSGGIDGRIIIDKFINSNFYKLLSKNSCFYLVTIAINKPKEIIDILAKKPYNLKAEIVAKKRVVREMLIIIRFTKK